MVAQQLINKGSVNFTSDRIFCPKPVYKEISV